MLFYCWPLLHRKNFAGNLLFLLKARTDTRWSITAKGACWVTFGACDTILSHYLVKSFCDLLHVVFLSFCFYFWSSCVPAIHNQGHYALGQETNSGPALLVQMVIPVLSLNTSRSVPDIPHPQRSRLQPIEVRANLARLQLTACCCNGQCIFMLVW